MRRSSPVRSDWPPPDLEPPWDELLGRRPAPRERALDLDVDQPVIAHLGADQIAQQLVELIHDEAGSLDADARRQVARRIMQAVAPWLSSRA